MIAFADNVLYEALPYGLVALGIVLAFRYLKVLDLTFAVSFVVGPAIAGSLLVHNVPWVFAVAVALGATLLLVALTVFEIWALELDSLLASLLTSFVGFSLALLFTQGTLSLDNVSTPYDAIRSFDYSWTAGNVPLHPAELLLFGAFVVLAKLLVDRFFNSELGLAFRAMEDERSRKSLLSSIGISDFRLLGIGLAAGNMLCALAGILVMLKENQVTASRGFDVFLAVITAYLFGTVLFECRPVPPEGRNVLVRALSKLAVFRPTTAALLGLLFYFTLLALVARLDVPASVPRLIMVVVVLVVVAATRSSDIAARIALARANRTQRVGAGAPFEADGIQVGYPGFPEPVSVLRNARLKLDANTAAQIRGPNGSGKSTLLRFLAGHIPGKGTVLVPSAAVTLGTDRAQLIGYVSQDAELGSAATLSVPENFALFSRGRTKNFWRRWRAPDTAALPSSARLLAAGVDGIPAGYLSGGQRQILGIASMLVRKDGPRVVLFDEPLTHLDEENAAACVELMDRLLAEGCTLVVVQHDVVPGTVYPASHARTRLARLMTQTVELEDLEA